MRALLCIGMTACAVLGAFGAEVAGLAVTNYDGAAYATVTDGGAWRIGIVNHAERLAVRERPLRVERHRTSDESFVVLSGACELVLGEGPAFTHVRLEPGKVYTIARGRWHAVMTAPGAKVLVVENADADTEWKMLAADGASAPR